MIQASVGWQCPQCVHAGARISPGRRWRPAARRGVFDWRAAPVTMALVAINVIAFLASGGGQLGVLYRWGLVPAAVQQGQVYRLLTSAFLHVSVAHIGLNMIALVFVGVPVEAAIGRLRYVALYLASALGGSVLYYLIGPLNVVAVGASGAIFGVFGAYFVFARRRGLRTGGILAVIAINLVYGFVEPNIGWQAHIGGLAVGVAVALGFVIAERQRGPVARTIEAATCVAVAVLLFALMQLPAGGPVATY